MRQIKVKVCIECSLYEDATYDDCEKYHEELCNSLRLLSKYILDNDIYFESVHTKGKSDLFITDCFDVCNSSTEKEVRSGLKRLFDFRWSGNTAVAIAFSFLHEEPLRFGCFETFAIDIFQVPYCSPELSHYICISDGTIDSLVCALTAAAKTAEESILQLKKQNKEMLALDLWPSLANRAAIPVLNSLTGTQYHDIAHGGTVFNVLEEAKQVVKICHDTPEFKKFLESLFPLIVPLQNLQTVLDKNGGVKDISFSDVMKAKAISILRKWPLSYAMDSLYRLGQSDRICEEKVSRWPEYSFIIEDNEIMANELRNILGRMGKRAFENKAAISTPDELTFGSLRNWIVDQWKRTKHLEDLTTRSIVLMDLAIGREKRGLDFMRRLKEEWPHITCLVISGFEQEVENAFSLGADGYIIKPIEADTLSKEIDRLRYIGSVCYILDKDSESRCVDQMNMVRSTATDPNETNEQKWNFVIEGLRKLFAYKRIQLFTMVVSGNRASLSEELADAMGADSFLIDCEGGLRGQNRPLFVDIARMIKLQDADKNFTILLPPQYMHKRPIWLYRYLRATFCEETDRFQQKPVFRFPFEHSESTVDAVYDQITYKRKIKYDVRYTILFPVEPIFGRFGQKQLQDDNEKGGMFVIPLINTFGFSVSMNMLIKVLKNPDIKKNKGKPQREMFETIVREIYVRDEQWKGFWRKKERSVTFDEELSKYKKNRPKYLGDYYGQIVKKLRRFSKELEKAKGFVTFESWIRHVIDEKMEDIWKKIWLKFGGDTRIELFLRGDWLNDEGKRVEDIHTLVYILTRHAPMYRKWIEENITKEIKKQLGEEEVLLEEERVKVFAT